MRVQSQKDFEEFLKPTLYCDHDNEIIITKAKELTEDDNSTKEKAISIF